MPPKKSVPTAASQANNAAVIRGLKRGGFSQAAAVRTTATATKRAEASTAVSRRSAQPLRASAQNAARPQPAKAESAQKTANSRLAAVGTSGVIPMKERFTLALLPQLHVLEASERH